MARPTRPGPPGGARPPGDRPPRDRPQGDRPQGDGTSGDRPGSGRPGHKRPGSRPSRGRPGADPGLTILYGWHPVAEALRNPRRQLRRFLATDNASRRVAEELGPIPIVPEIVRIDEISRLLEPDAVHQGLYLEADPLDGPDLDSLPPDAVVIALDQVTDPHNVGAIVRTAAAFGAAAILTTARHSPSATGVLAKAASGGLEHVPFVTVGNLANALIDLKDRGFQIIGLDSDGGESLADIRIRRPTIVVLGAEGRGLRQRTRTCCDVVARLDMAGAIKSLNVSNAAAIALYAFTAGSAVRSEPRRDG